MDLNIILWFIGMFFSLGVFAVKVGFGVAFGRLSKRQIGIILGGYLLLFTILAIVSDKLFDFTAPILKGGVYIHIAMSAGLALWGIMLLHSSCEVKEGCNNNSRFKVQSLRVKIPRSILLIIPCPVCITAIGISVSSALSVLKASPIIIGLFMGLLFVFFSGGFAYILKPKSDEFADIPLGLTMIAIALYFIGSLFIPQKIEEARLAYQAFSVSSSTLQTTESMGVLILFCTIFLLGFLFYKDIEDIL